MGPTTAPGPSSAAATTITRLRRTAVEIDEQTPADRDRVMDLLRVASMLVVALGHWIMAIVWVDADGSLATASLLVAAPSSQWLTLALQVMGLFFAVGGWASARSMRERPASLTSWLHGRIRRLLAPATAYVAVVAVLVPAVGGLVGPDVSRVAQQAFTVHLWFCAVVVPLYLLTPALLAAWRAWAHRLLVVLVGGALTVDVAHRVLELPVVGWVNFLFVWGAVTVLGFAWADGHVGRAVARRMAVGGTLALTALVATPWVPLSMVGVVGAEHSNNHPPSVALVALTVVHVGLVELARPWLRRLTDRPLVWATVVLAGRGAVTVYLWHLLGMGLLIAGVVTFTPGLLAVEPLTAAWWLTRTVWLAALVLVTAPLVAAALPIERRQRPTGHPGAARTLIGTGLATTGCVGLVLTGLGSTWAVLAVIVGAVVGRWLPLSGAGAR